MNETELQQLLDATAEELGVVGAQLAIYEGRRQREFATGYRNRELQLPVTHDTLFQIGSTTKLFNAAVVMSLVDSGELALDTPVREFIPDLRLADAEAQQRITLRHLLSMTAGMDNGTYHDYGRGDDALGRYVDALAGLPHIFAPGSAFGYSNASSNVAGYAASRVTGQTWERLLTERIWAPLGLKQCGLFAEDLLWHPLALGYQERAADGTQQRQPAWSISRSISPAGALACCSAGDLIGFARMFLEGGKSVEGNPVLSASAVESMHKPLIKLPTRLFADQWCLGPYRKRWGEHVIYGHSGTNLSGSSLLLWCPQADTALATTVNVSTQGYPFAEAICAAVFPNLFGIEKPRAATPENVVEVKSELQPFVGRFEAHGMTLSFVEEEASLWLSGTIGGTAVNDCRLISLGDGRFLPCDPRVSGNRNWDIAFWGSDASGRATHLLEGIFALRRTG